MYTYNYFCIDCLRCANDKGTHVNHTVINIGSKGRVPRHPKRSDFVYMTRHISTELYHSNEKVKSFFDKYSPHKMGPLKNQNYTNQERQFMNFPMIKQNNNPKMEAIREICDTIGNKTSNGYGSLIIDALYEAQVYNEFKDLTKVDRKQHLKLFENKNDVEMITNEIIKLKYNTNDYSIQSLFEDRRFAGIYLKYELGLKDNNV